MKYNNIISESLRDYVRQSLITEEDSRIKGTKNAIKRCVAAIVKEDINSENVLNLSSEIWDYYVVKPIAGENRQLDEYIAIRNNSTILVKSVVKYDYFNEEFYVLKYKRLRDNFERLIQSQRIDNKSSIVDNEKGNINHWATNRQVEDLKASENTNNGRYKYTAYKIDDYGTPIEGLGMTVEELGRYTGGKGNLYCLSLCYTQDLNTYNSYTDDNKYTMYALLRDGWQDEPCVIDEETYPLDSYGLSIIFVIINPNNGKIVNSNVRWNHGPKTKNYNRDVDNIFSFTELNDIVGSSLMHKIGVQNEMDKSFSLTKEVESRLQQGESPSQIFDSFDEYDLKYHRLVRVKYKGMYNYITQNYDIFSDIWFDSAYGFSDGVAMVEINRLRNYLKEDGTFAYNKPIDEWLNYAFPFSDGFACIEVDFKYNFMRKDGSMLLDKWYDNAVPFDDGYGTVCYDKKWNLVDTEGNFIWKEFKFVDCRILFPPNEFGCYNVSTTNGWNYLNKNLQPMSKEYFDNCLYMEKLKNGFIIIRTVQRPYKYLGVDGILHDEPQDLTPIISDNNPSMLTEDRKQQIRSIRNKIRDVIIRKTSVLKNFDQSKIEPLVDDVWNKYVEHPNNGEKRQNDEITIINQNIQRFVPFVLSTRDGNVEVVKTRKLSNCWENFIQAQKQNKGVDLLGDGNIVYWNAKNKYDEALKSVSNTEYEGSYHYTVYKVEDYGIPIEGLGMTVEELGNYTGGQGAVPLCYTQSDGTYNSYTRDNKYTMYALLRDGWQAEQCEIGKGYPLDSYGLSMIFVIISPTGSIVNNNVRWNHGPKRYSRKVDNIFTYNELTDIVGSDVMNQIRAHVEIDDSIQKTYEVEEQLDNGEDIEDIFDDIEIQDGKDVIIVRYKWYYNLLVINKETMYLLSDEWFDSISRVNDDVFCVKRGGRYNLLKTDGSYVFDEWLEDAFVDKVKGQNCVTICKDHVYNVLLPDGTYLFDEGYSYIGVFANGCVRVEKYYNGTVLCNLADENGHFIWDKPVELWFNWITNGHLGIPFFPVRIGKQFNFLKRDGTLFLNTMDVNEWLTHLQWSNVFDIYFVKKNRKWNLITVDGKMLWNKPENLWLDKIVPKPSEWGFGIRKGKKWNYMRLDGTLIWNHENPRKWFDDLYESHLFGYSVVSKKGIDYHLQTDGKLYGKDDDSGYFNKEIIDFANNGKPIYADESTLIKESLKEYVKENYQMLVEGSTIKTIRNKIARSISAAIGADMNDDQVQRLTDDVWNTYVVAHNRQNREYTAINKNIERLIPYVLKKNSDHTYEIRKTSRIKNGFEALIQAQRDNMEGQILDKHNNNLLSWYADKSYNDAVENAKKEVYEADHIYSAYKIEDYYIPIEGLGMTVKELGQYTGGENTSPLCYTQSESTYNSYTRDNTYTMYALLREGWQDEPCEDTEGYPYDSYGLSMIFVIIDTEDEIKFSNVRWNHGDHSYSKVDFMFTYQSLSKIVGSKIMNYICANHKFAVDYSLTLTKEFEEEKSNNNLNGRKYDIDTNEYDGYRIIRRKVYGDGIIYYNYVDSNLSLLTHRWFYSAYRFDNGCAVVRSLNNQKYNILRTDGTFVWDKPEDEWFTYAFIYNGRTDYIMVRDENRDYNLLTQDGHLFLDKWVQAIEPFDSNGVARIRVDNKLNYIRTDKTFVWDKPLEEWFDGLDRDKFQNGIAKVFIDGNPFYLDLNGNLSKTPHQNTALMESIKKNFLLLTEDQKKTIRNKIARAVAANLVLDVNDEDVQRMTDEIWNAYVVHPIAGEKRQNDEITVINQNIERLIPYVIKYNNSGSEFYLNNHPRIHKSWENLIQAQRQNRQTKLWQDNETLLYWNTKQAYDSLSKQNDEIVGKYHYTVYKVEDYNTPIEGLGMTVTELGEYTGGQGAVPLCYTQTEGTYNSYTRDNTNTIYALLRDGWRNEPCKIEEGYPLDSYGLSMIFVIASPKGTIEYNNVRWNHGPKGYPRRVDNIFSYQELQQIVGSNIMKQIGDITNVNSTQLTYEVEQKLSQGVDWLNIFTFYDEVENNVYQVWYKGKCNLIDIAEEMLLSDIWFDEMKYVDGEDIYFVVRDNGLYNFLRTDGTLIWDKPEDLWLENEPQPFQEGFARIRVNGRANLINMEGKLLLPYEDISKWPRGFGKMINGLAVVRYDNGKRNFINREGKYIWDKPIEQWFDWTDRVEHFPDYIYVEIEFDEYQFCNLIRRDGTLVWDKEDPHEWFDLMYYEDVYFMEKGFVKVQKNNKELMLSLTNGTLYTIVEYRKIQQQLNENANLLTEDQERTIRNKIARGVATITKMDAASQEVQSMTDEIWNVYVKHPIEGEKRQNDEVWAINTVISRLIPYVVKQNEEGNFFVNKNSRIKDAFENLIQAQRMEQQSKKQLWNNDESLTYWNVNRKYNDAIDAVNQKQTVGKYNYSVYKVDGYDTPIEGLGMTVKQLGKYTGGQGAVPLCYTQSESTYNRYTNDNEYNMYALLRDGWKYEQPEIGEGYPLDSYGLSMIFVIVGTTGTLQFNNVRWNHGPKGYPRQVDNIFSYTELCEIVGSNVIRQIGIISYDEIDKSLSLTHYVEQKLKEKVPLDDIFSDYNRVFGTDYYRVKLDGLQNIIDEQGDLLFDYWFEYVDYWGKGIFRVSNQRKYNFILPNGSFVIDNKDTSQWFERVGSFLYSNGAFIVELNGKYNYIRYDGAYVWDKPWEEWFDDANSFEDKDGVLCAFVYKNSEIDDTLKANIILVDGTLMFNEWVCEDDFHEDENGNEVCQVTKNGKYNLLDISGDLKYSKFMDFDDFKKVYPKAVLQQ